MFKVGMTLLLVTVLFGVFTVSMAGTLRNNTEIREEDAVRIADQHVKSSGFLDLDEVMFRYNFKPYGAKYCSWATHDQIWLTVNCGYVETVNWQIGSDKLVWIDKYSDSIDVGNPDYRIVYNGEKVFITARCLAALVSAAQNKQKGFR